MAEISRTLIMSVVPGNLDQISFVYVAKIKPYFLLISWTNMNESERSGMAVLDVTIPTGYIIQQQKLDAYILSKRVRNLQRAKFAEKKVLFYFDYVRRILKFN
jgi:hypothetical protein